MDFKSNLQVYLFGKDHMNNHPTGIRVSLNSNGRMIITADHVSDLQVSYVTAKFALNFSSITFVLISFLTFLVDL